MRVNQSGSNPAANTEVQGSKKAERTATADARAANGKKKSEAIPGSVNADISLKGKEMAHAKAAAAGAPDVREQKIAELKRRIESGQYNVSPDNIADRMVDEHLRSGIG